MSVDTIFKLIISFCGLMGLAILVIKNIVIKCITEWKKASKKEDTSHKDNYNRY